MITHEVNHTDTVITHTPQRAVTVIVYCKCGDKFTDPSRMVALEKHEHHVQLEESYENYGIEGVSW